MSSECNRLTAEFIEERAKAAGLSLEELCGRAGIALSTFYRWRAGVTEPRLETYRLLLAATEPAAAA